MGVDFDDVMRRVRAGAPDFAVHLLLASFTVDWMRGHRANVCVQACVHLADAAALLGLDAVTTPVRIIVDEPGGQRAVYGTEHPTWSGPAFSGHCILFLPGEDRIIDPTIRQIDGLQHLPYPYVGKVVVGDTASRELGPDSALRVEVQDRWIQYHVVEGGEALLREADATSLAVAANPDLPGAIAAQTLDAIRGLGLTERLPARHGCIRALLSQIGTSNLHRDGTRFAFLIDGRPVEVTNLMR